MLTYKSMLRFIFTKCLELENFEQLCLSWVVGLRFKKKEERRIVFFWLVENLQFRRYNFLNKCSHTKVCSALFLQNALNLKILNNYGFRGSWV